MVCFTVRIVLQRCPIVQMSSARPRLNGIVARFRRRKFALLRLRIMAKFAPIHLGKRMTDISDRCEVIHDDSILQRVHSGLVVDEKFGSCRRRR